MIDGDYPSAKDIFNNELRLHKVSSPANLRTLLKEPFFLDEEISGNILTSRYELDYIRSTIICKRLVKRLSKGLKSDRDIIFAMFDWTVRNIGIGIRHDVGAEVNGYPYDNMMRGFGMCDRSAWVLANLAFQAGYSANIISMPNHALTMIYLEDTWALFDPHYGVIYKNSQKLLSLEDVKEVNAVIEANDIPYVSFLKDLISSNIVTICTPSSLLPKMENLQKVLNQNCDDPPRVYYDILGELSFSISTISSSIGAKVKNPVVVPHIFPERRYRLMVWLFPFELRYFHKSGKYAENMEKYYPGINTCRKARELQIMGNFEDAIVEYDRCLSAKSDSGIKGLLVYNKALCFYETGDYKIARQLFLLCKQNYPDGKEIKGVDYHLGLITNVKNTVKINHNPVSKKDVFHYRLIDQIEINTNNGYAKEMSFVCFCHLAGIYQERGRLDKVRDLYEKALLIRPDNGDVNYLLGTLCLINNDTDNAILRLTKALKSKPAYYVYQDLGKAYFRDNRYNDAKSMFLKAIEINQEDVNSHFSLALTYLKNNEKDSAIVEYQKVIALEPGFVNAYYNLGLTYMEIGRLKAAQTEFKKLLDIDPDHAMTHYMLGLAYYKDNKLEKSLFHSNKARALGIKGPPSGTEKEKGSIGKPVDKE